MTTAQDCSIGLGLQGTFGTNVTPTRWLEFSAESLDYRKGIVQGSGLRVGSRVARSGRRVVATMDGGGDISLDVLSKGMGLVWQACMGSGSSTLVSAGVYQQVFTFADTMPFVTVQKGLPRSSGTVDALTFGSSVVTGWELGMDKAGILKLKTTWDCRDLDTATAYAPPSYPAGTSNLFAFAGGAIHTGTLTAPTTTALAAGATPVANVTDFGITVSNGLATDRFFLGGAGKKSAQLVQGLRSIGGKLTVEYDSTIMRDALIADTPMSLVLTFTAGALAAGTETLQVVIPEIKLDGELPKANAGNLVAQGISFTGLDGLSAAQPMWLVARTADTAL